MKIFAVGGSGAVGRGVLGLLAPSDLVTQIAVVGRNLAHAEETAAALGGKANAVRADAGDERELAHHMAGYDLVLNAATDETVLPVLRAAIEAGAHYCDVNLVDEAMELTDKAEAAGIAAIIKNGIGPGLSSLMGVHVARQLDEVRQLQRGIASLVDFDSLNELTSPQWLEDPEGARAALREFGPFMTWLLQMTQENGTRTMLDHQDGRWVEVDPVRLGVDVPHGGGTGFSYPYVSLDSFWQALPTDLGDVAPMEMWFSTLPPRADAVLRDHALPLRDGDVEPETAIGAFLDVVESDPQRWLTVPEDHVPIPIMWVRAVGQKNGRPARCDCWVSAPLPKPAGWLLTNAALAAAALKILRGEVSERGVMAAEQAFDPPSFFEEMAGLLPEPPPHGQLVGESLHWLD